MAGSSARKKWGFHYCYTGNGGKMWGKMFICGGVKTCRGDCAVANARLTFCQIQLFTP